jgi:signal transduction histidine kinase
LKIPDQSLTIDTVRTPLNAIINYLNMALENNVDDKTRDILARAEKASNSLVYVMDDLVKLTETEEGSVHPTDETFNLKQTGKCFINICVSILTSLSI